MGKASLCVARHVPCSTASLSREQLGPTSADRTFSYKQYAYKLALLCSFDGCMRFHIVRQAIICEVPKTRAFETRFQISYSVCECVALISAACVNMS
jgi:hypothetical protein